MATRAEFLERIRREARRTDGLFKATTATRPARPEEAAEAVRRQMAERWPEALDLFRREFDRVGGVFHRAADRAEVPSVVLEIAREEGATAVVAWDPAVLGLDLRPRLVAEGLSVAVAATARSRRGPRSGSPAPISSSPRPAP